MTNFDQVIEKILNHFAGPQFKDEVQLAKKEFFENAGILDENSDQFESRMSQFFDWYFFTRDLSGYAQTPLESCHMARELRFTDEENNMIAKLKAHRHGLFEFIKNKNGDIYLKDLLANKKLVVKNCPWSYGFNSEEIFEARLIPLDEKENYAFSKGFCFHPAEAKKFILSEVKRHRKDPDLNPDEMMLRLTKMRYKFEQYRHVKLDMIYSNESKLGV